RDKKESIIFRGDDNSYYEKLANGSVICIDEELPFAIPDSWSWERLSNIAVFSGGKTPSTAHTEFWNGDIPWITSKDMKSKYVVSSLLKLSDLGAQSMQRYAPNTLLLVTRSGILRHTLPVAILKTEATINQDLKAIEFIDNSLVEYIYVCLKGLETSILQKYAKSGTTVENINFDEFKHILLPIPPEAERIRLENQIAKVTSHIDAISSILE
ncbi:MAG: restriction endonuclease subunit S, partial [Tyzzerella sp.]|nr:restriction endonuclease subunit S [Tyzzerella sp.]